MATEIFVGPYIMGNTLTDGVKNDLIDCGIDNNPVLPDVLYRFRAPESRRYTGLIKREGLGIVPFLLTSFFS